jgi:hypothetical protein
MSNEKRDDVIVQGETVSSNKFVEIVIALVLTTVSSMTRRALPRSRLSAAMKHIPQP